MKSKPANSATKIALVPCRKIRIGEFVRKITICSTCFGDGSDCAACESLGYIAGKKVYERLDYSPSLKKYSLADQDDFCREVFVKGDTMLQIGFTY